MRSWIALVACALVASLIVRARADGPRTERVGFDHGKHEVALDKRGDAAMSCTKCHTLRGGEVAGKPGHAACFGACHGAAPKATTGKPLEISDTQKPLCLACHAESKLFGPVPADRTWYRTVPQRAQSFALAFGHQTHVASTCTDCHARPDQQGQTGGPHRRCTSCHDGKSTPSTKHGFAMTECRGCHVRAAETTGRVQMIPAEILVATAFSHGKHAARGAAGKQCATCHAGVADSNARALPRPTMASCATAGCHDDKAAFGVTARCTTCHADPPKSLFLVARPTTRFSHTSPAHQAANLPCITCHAVGTTNEVVVSGHAPCAGCHEQDFGARKPKICGACHNGTEPWRTLVADRLPAERTEFGVSLDHSLDKHAASACASCHRLTTATVQLRPPRGHTACTASGCHARSGGAKPTLVECVGCHELGLRDRRDATRRAATWSVRTRFDHGPHEQTKATASTPAKVVPCAACHVDLSAKRVIDLGAPPKRTCAPCHDGTTAFELTGTSCTRCHPGPTK